MNWSDVKDIVGKAAPLVGSLLGGPAGGAVGSMVAHALGTDDSPDAVVNALKANPDALVKVKQIEADHAEKLQELQVTAENNRLTAETQRYKASQKTIQTQAQYGTDYVKNTRPKIARLSFYAGAAYALGMTIAHVAITGAPGPDAALLGTLFGPCGFYMTMRSVDAFSKTGKTE